MRFSSCWLLLQGCSLLHCLLWLLISAHSGQHNRECIFHQIWWMFRYNLPLFSLRLNEMTPGLEVKLPPTDVRRRWDLRALEQGDYDKVPCCCYHANPNALHCCLQFCPPPSLVMFNRVSVSAPMCFAQSILQACAVFAGYSCPWSYVSTEACLCLHKHAGFKSRITCL
jgi:hypothetical protein